MYSEEDLLRARQQRASRVRAAVIPAAVALAAAIALFVYGQIIRSDQLWMVTVALTIAGCCYFLFLYGVSIHPMRMYELHIRMMLHGKKRETTGILKSFGEKCCEKNGVDCYPMVLNVGEKNDGKDDRLFYFDAHREKPAIAPGTSMTVESNDMMVAAYRVN